MLRKTRDDGICYLSSDPVDNLDVEQLAKDRFSPVIRWEYLEEKDKSVVLKDELEVYGVKYNSSRKEGNKGSSYER